MALMHNAIFRGFNSIYQQAPRIRDEDKAAFVAYALTWHKLVKRHHDDEEAELFTKVEEILGEKVFEKTHEEHRS
jgi:hemerythrin-like domain-containing protein